MPNTIRVANWLSLDRPELSYKLLCGSVPYKNLFNNRMTL
eukprot:CAMPEP_0185786950 /NCGR_PEP_ID=MMETSP1174-20130828/137976_1 /TAXON_ID=35687 /ORGANISM="Dictyocha speculum, Strain CCMP1381" /LENGTH=39 /DNA_ID= /DNA_START= /DNA_END= /DNA_ORIENTATION=